VFEVIRIAQAKQFEFLLENINIEPYVPMLMHITLNSKSLHLYCESLQIANKITEISLQITHRNTSMAM